MKISACVITKNEEMNIVTCLESVKQIVSEIILVDTGSTDNTVQMALKYGAKIYYFQWQNDFSKARNYAISKASGDWIIFLDADEYYTKESITMIPDVLYEAEKGNYDVIFSILVNYEKHINKSFGTAPVIRIFRNNKGLEYKGAVHELLYTKDGRPLKKLDATKYLKIIHTGYSKEIINEKNKGKRNLDLLLEEERIRQNDSNLCFYISEAYILMNEREKAIEYGFMAIKYNNGSLIGIYQKNYLNILQSMTTIGYPIDDVKYVAKKASKEYPDFPDFHFFLGDMYRHEGRIMDAIQEYEDGIGNIHKGLNYQSSAPFYISKVLGFLGDLYHRIRQFDMATKYYVEILKGDPYEFSTLRKLLLLFSKFEKNEDIYEFMKKLYDYSCEKDLLFLLKASLRSKNITLAEIYYRNIDESRYEDLKNEKANIKLLNGDYEDASKEYRVLYEKILEEVYALKFIISALLSDDKKSLLEIAEIVKPSIKRIIGRTLKQEVEFLSDDRKDILNFFKEYVKIEKANLLVDYMDWIEDTDILYEVSELLFYYEQYVFSSELYKAYLENESFIFINKRTAILLRLGECMYNAGQYKDALLYYNEAREIAPHNYGGYEIPIYICELLNDYDQLRIIAQRGTNIFPDSFFLQSKSKNYH
jgi:glycosyltransferase involved in cell wall biosynthesis